MRDPERQLLLKSLVTDRLGMTHLRFDQRHEGLPVFGRQLVLHFDRSAVTAVNGEFTPDIGVVTTPLVSAAEADGIARRSLAVQRSWLTPAPPTLLVSIDATDRPHLAWLVSVPTKRPLGFWRVFVDAVAGVVLSSYDDLQTAKNRFTHTNGNNPDCPGEGFPLCTLPGTLVRAEPGPASGDAAIDAAHDNAGTVYDFFNAVFGRDSYDGAGHSIRSTAHFGSDYDNAAWCPDDCAAAFGSLIDGEQMIYGDGDGFLFSPLSQALDVVAHELTHAVTGSEANLTYQGQSGALNESYSDVFAAMVDSDDWLIAEDVFTPDIEGDALRSLEDPELYGQPAHMSAYVHTFFDNGGVHINSGIPSKAAYLIASDPAYGIGRSDTQEIYYRALTVYLTPSADFMANLNALVQSAEDLFGVGSAQALAITRAHAAVGLANPPIVTFPNGGEFLQQGSPITILWDPGGGVWSSFGVELLLDFGVIEYLQNFEASPTLPPEFQTGGAAPWVVDTFEPGGGARSASSGLIGDGQRSELSLTRRMTAAGDVSFRVRVSSELDFDFFSFYVDGVGILSGSGEIPWQFVNVGVTAGTHTFTWIYEKDSFLAEGLDGAWIDDLVIPNTENVAAATINAATLTGADSQTWTPPDVSGANFRVRVRTLGVVPWLDSDESDELFGIGNFVAATVSAIDPTSGPAAGGTGVTLTGTNFQAGAAVAIGGLSASGVSVPSAMQITAATPSLSPGTLNDVTVTNPGASAGTLVNGWLADFSDVPQAHMFHDRIEDLFRSGVTSGCGGGNFCPAQNVTRAQTAVFLLKGIHGAAYTPPPATGTVFDDVGIGDFAAANIEQLAEEGITSGCGNGNYCPDGSATREQMAIFLLRSKHGAAYMPPAATGDFDDVPVSSPYAKWIEQLAAEGITAGCGGNNYCPSQAVTRGQMAVFLVKTFDLP